MKAAVKPVSIGSDLFESFFDFVAILAVASWSTFVLFHLMASFIGK